MSEQKKPHHGYRLPAQPDSSPPTQAPSHTGRKNSELGIASFVISISGYLFLTIGFFVSASDAAAGPFSGLLMAFVFGIGFVLVELVALGLGIWGLCQKEKKKTLAILGTEFSSVGTLIVAVMLLKIFF